MESFEKDYEREYLERRAEMERARMMELRYLEEKKRRQTKLALMLAMGLAPIFLLATRFIDLPDTFSFVSYGIVGIALVLSFFTYLQPTRIRSNGLLNEALSSDLREEFVRLRSRNKEFESQNRELRERFDKIVKQLQKGGAAGELFSQSDKDKILSRIQAKLESDSLEDYQRNLVSLVNDRLRTKLQEDIFTQISSRLASEVENLAKRGNVNLILGISTTLAGLAILGYSVFDAPEMTTLLDIASHFIPRLSLVVLIEVFAYFFLKLYKSSLSEIKYFQNEITNIESKYLALQVAINSENEESVRKIVDSLIQTERNFVLHKGQSTIELEQNRIESQQSSELIKVVDSLAKKIK